MDSALHLAIEPQDVGGRYLSNRKYPAFATERIYADDTTVLVLAKGKKRTVRLWAYVRDNRDQLCFGLTAFCTSP
jgi:hypothetical protein